ncbi:MAG: A/G-specific adenine glycosylase, partial [Planctomycetota bacterium]
MSAPAPDELVKDLCAWFERAQRDLPWRRTRDPYAVWISEAMLQQTRVETVIPYWSRFIARFPDVRALAGASEDDVVAAWSGLGYYRRARALREAARAMVERHAGACPTTRAE